MYKNLISDALCTVCAPPPPASDVSRSVRISFLFWVFPLLPLFLPPSLLYCIWNRKPNTFWCYSIVTHYNNHTRHLIDPLITVRFLWETNIFSHEVTPILRFFLEREMGGASIKGGYIDMMGAKWGDTFFGCICGRSLSCHFLSSSYLYNHVCSYIGYQNTKT